MKPALLLIACVSLTAAEIAAVPSVGFVLSPEGRLAAVSGVAAALIVEPAGEVALTTAAYSGRLLLTLSPHELRAITGSAAASAPNVPLGPVLFGFCPSGECGAAYSLDTGNLQIWNRGRWDSAQVPPEVFAAVVLAVALPDPDHLAALVTREGLRLIRVRISDGAVEQDALIHPEAGGPAVLLPSGGMLYSVEGGLRYRHSSGREQHLDIPRVSALSFIGKDWIQAVGQNDTRFAIRHHPELRVMEMPAVSQ